jgi:hypothetical protein
MRIEKKSLRKCLLEKRSGSKKGSLLLHAGRIIGRPDFSLCDIPCLGR